MTLRLIEGCPLSATPRGHHTGMVFSRRRMSDRLRRTWWVACACGTTGTGGPFRHRGIAALIAYAVDSWCPVTDPPRHVTGPTS